MCVWKLQIKYARFKRRTNIIYKFDWCLYCINLFSCSLEYIHIACATIDKLNVKKKDQPSDSYIQKLNIQHLCVFYELVESTEAEKKQRIFFNLNSVAAVDRIIMHIYGENMNKSSLVDGSKVITTRSPLTSRPIMDELTPAKNDTVPLTPEILNSVMAMTNPLEYSMAAANNSKLQVIYCILLLLIL